MSKIKENYEKQENLYNRQLKAKISEAHLIDDAIREKPIDEKSITALAHGFKKNYGETHEETLANERINKAKDTQEKDIEQYQIPQRPRNNYPKPSDRERSNDRGHNGWSR